MYRPTDKYLQCGDIFPEVPIPLVDPGLFPAARLDIGPAMLIDGDCSIDKLAAEAFNFAPIYSLEGIDASSQGNVRSNRVRRYFYLEPDPMLGVGEFYANLQEIFSLRRDLFAVNPVTLSPRETRIELTSNTSLNRRLMCLDPPAVAALKLQVADFFDLRKAVVATSGP